jgi:hypothetical protein
MLTMPGGNDRSLKKERNCKFNEYIFLINHVCAATPTTAGFKEKKKKNNIS